MSSQILSVRKWRPLDISFDPSDLMTGQSLVPVKCGDRTSFIRAEKYAALKTILKRSAILAKPVGCVEAPTLEPDKGYDGRLLIGELKDRKGKRFIRLSAAKPYRTEDEHKNELGDQKHNEPTDFWSLIRAEEFNPAEWRIVPLPCLPAVHQLPPIPLKNAENYETFFISNIRKRTAAKTGNGQKKFQKKMGEAWADRKRLYQCGKKLLKDAGFNKHSSDALGPADMRDSCPRCGCSLFVPKKRNSLNCYDCGFEWLYGAENLANENEQDEGLTEQVERTVTPRMTAQDFVSTLIVAGKMGDLQDKNKLRKLSGTFLQVCHGWIASDVQKEPDFWHETAETIRKRATRFMRDFNELKKAGKFPPLNDSAGMSLAIPSI
jgi:hypothetical protein